MNQPTLLKLAFHGSASLVLTLLATGYVSAASGSDEGGDGAGDQVEESSNGLPFEAKVKLDSIVPGATGGVWLQLVSRAGVPVLKAQANAKGLDPSIFYSLCADGVHVAHGEADNGGKLELDEEILSPRESLVGMNVTIHVGVGCRGAAVMHAVV